MMSVYALEKNKIYDIDKNNVDERIEKKYNLCYEEAEKYLNNKK